MIHNASRRATSVAGRMHSRARRAFGAAAALELAGLSLQGILAAWGLEVALPLENPGACAAASAWGSGPRACTRDGERGVRQRVVGREDSEGHRSLPLIGRAGRCRARARTSPVVGLHVGRVGSEMAARKALGRFRRAGRRASQVQQATVGERGRRLEFRSTAWF